MSFMLRNRLLTLAEPGSDGGTGGGGESPAPGVPPLPSVSARERIYDNADAAPNSGDDGVTAPPAPAADPAKPPESPDSAKAGEATPDPDKGKGKVVVVAPDPAEKRLKDAQAALHAQTQENARLKREKAESDAKLAKVGKYVDLDKLEEHDKTETEADLDKPVTKRDLESLKTAPPPAEQPSDSPSTLDAPAREKFLSDYYAANAHVLPYAQSGEAYGVFLKEAERLGPEIAGLSELDQLTKIGDAVATHFRTKDADREKAIAARINTKRENIGAGSLPGTGGAPGTGDAEDPGDDPGAEMAHRNAVRNRVLRPTL